MIFKEDFEYIKRLNNPWKWIFNVKSETSGYLLNKYDISAYPVQVTVWLDSVNDIPHALIESVNKEVDLEDAKDIWIVVDEIIRNDIANWHEYICNDIYKPDSRWT